MEGGTANHAFGWLIAILHQWSRLPPPPPPRTITVAVITTVNSVVKSAHTTPAPSFDSSYFNALSHDTTTSFVESFINGTIFDTLRQWLGPYALVLFVLVLSILLNITLSWGFARQLHAAQTSRADKARWMGEAARVADACDKQVGAEREQMMASLSAKEQECDEQLASSQHIFDERLRAKTYDFEAQLRSQEDEFYTQVKALTAQMKLEVMALDIKYSLAVRMDERWTIVKENAIDDLRMQIAEKQQLLDQAEQKASTDKVDLHTQISEKQDLLEQAQESASTEKTDLRNQIAAKQNLLDQTEEKLAKTQRDLHRAMRDIDISDRRFKQCSPKQVAHLKAAIPKALSIPKAVSESVTEAPPKSDSVQQTTIIASPPTIKKPVFGVGMHCSQWAPPPDDVEFDSSPYRLALSNVPDPAMHSGSPYKLPYQTGVTSPLYPQPSNEPTTSIPLYQAAAKPVLSSSSTTTPESESLGPHDDESSAEAVSTKVCYYRSHHTQPGERHTCALTDSTVCNGVHICKNTYNGTCDGHPDQYRENGAYILDDATYMSHYGGMPDPWFQRADGSWTYDQKIMDAFSTFPVSRNMALFNTEEDFGSYKADEEHHNKRYAVRWSLCRWCYVRDYPNVRKLHPNQREKILEERGADGAKKELAKIKFSKSRKLASEEMKRQVRIAMKRRT